MSPVTKIRVLGPVCIEHHGEIVDCGSPQQRATLAVLAVNAGSPTPVERIAAAIWGDSQPSSAHGTVRTCVYWLRKTLAGIASDDAAIKSTRQGYVLSMSSLDVVDMHLFARLVDEARALSNDSSNTRAALLSEAVDLWQGSAFGSLGGEYFDTQRARLAGERVAAVQNWCEAAIEIGHLDHAISTLHELIGADPFNERPHELLMLALARSGRRAEALKTYECVRRRLAGELGIDPGPQLSELHQRVLRSDPTLSGADPVAKHPPSLAPAQLPSDLIAFSGRDAEVAEAIETPAHVTLIHGTAGVGKTTLAVRVAHQIASRFPDGQLFINLQGFDPTKPPAHPSKAIKALLDGLGIPAAQVPDDLPAQTAYYRSVLADKRCLIVLDNARDSTQILPLLPGHAGCAVIVTSRAMLTQLVMTTGPRVIGLDLLSSEAAANLLRARLGDQRIDADPAAIQQIVVRCARLPLALAITAARASLHPHLPLAGIAAELADVHSSLDAFTSTNPELDVRSVISWSYTALSPESARLFRLLSLNPGTVFDSTVAANLYGATRLEVIPLLSELVGANLVQQPRPQRFSWHDLIRAAATEESAKHTEDSTGAFGRLLDYYFKATSNVAATLSKKHHLPPQAVTEHEAIVQEDFADYQTAVVWLAERYHTILALIDQVAGIGYHSAAWQLAWCLRHFQDRQGHWKDLLAVQRIALDSARSAGDLVGMAHAHRGLARAMTLLKDYGEADAHIREAIGCYEAAGDRTELGYCKVQHSLIAELVGDEQGALASAREALTIFQELGWQPGIASSLATVGHYETVTGNPRVGITLCRKAIAIFEAIDDSYALAMAWGSLGYASYANADYQSGVSAWEESLKILSRLNCFSEQVGIMRLLLHAYTKLGNEARIEEITPKYHELSSSLTAEQLELIPSFYRLDIHHRADRVAL